MAEPDAISNVSIDHFDGLGQWEDLPRDARWIKDLRFQAARRGMKNIEALIADGGDITVGPIGPVDCAATAADGHDALAMLVRRDGETLGAPLERLDRAIARVHEIDQTTAEINPTGD